MKIPERIPLFFKVREPAYNLVRWINHEGEHKVIHKGREELSKLVEIFKDVESFGAWVQRTSVPKHCRVDFNDKELFVAYCRYFVSFFNTSLEIKEQYLCEICNIKDHVLGPRKSDSKSKSKARDLKVGFLVWLNKQASLDLSHERIEKLADSKAKVSSLLNYCTYVFEASKRVHFKGEGPPVHVLWKAMSKEDIRCLSYEDFLRRLSYLEKLVQEN